MATALELADAEAVVVAGNEFIRNGDDDRDRDDVRECGGVKLL